MTISIIIRTFNEEEHLSDLLTGVGEQELGEQQIEVVVVDSGSTDSTLVIAEKHKCNIVHISKDDFTFGRSLNVGCAAARGELLVFVSGHCIPTDRLWLHELIKPLIDGKAVYSYGRQIGNEASKFSEQKLFGKYYPGTSKIPQDGFFCNNANAALRKDIWEEYKFDEGVTGLEDMELAKRITKSNQSIAYVSSSVVYHLHSETWRQVKTRYEREAIALQKIMPEVHVNLQDFMRYFFSGVFYDIGAAIQEKCLLRKFVEIVLFRLMQYSGSYKGNHEHRELSKSMKEKYFYPK